MFPLAINVAVREAARRRQEDQRRREEEAARTAAAPAAPAPSPPPSKPSYTPVPPQPVDAPRKYVKDVVIRGTPSPAEPAPVTDADVKKHLTEPIVTKADHVFRSPQQPVMVEWEDKSGKVHKVHTKVEDIGFIQSDPIVHRIVSVYDMNQQVMVHDIPTTQEWNVAAEKASKEKYQETGEVPSWFKAKIGPPAVVLPGGIIRRTVSHGVFTRGLYPEYIRKSYEVSIGVKTTAEATRELQKSIEQATTVDWMKQYGRFDGKTWKQLKAEETALYMTGTGADIKIMRDVSRWEKEETARAWREGDWGHIARGAFTWVFNPKRMDYMTESLRGPTTPGYGATFETEQARLSKILSEGYYEQEMKIRKGDIGGWATGTIFSPVGLGIITMGIGTGTSAFASTTLGGRTLFTVGGKIIPAIGVKPSTYVKVAIGGAFVGAGAAGMEQAYKVGGWRAVEEQVKKAALMSPYLIASYQVGASYGPQLAYKTGQVVSGAKAGFISVIGGAYKTYAPSTVKSIFSAVKQKVTTWDPYFKTRIYHKFTPQFIKTAKVDVSRWYSEFKTHRAATIYGKDISYYGQELYPYAVKHKLVKDVGLSKLSELRTPYSHYKTSGWWGRPEHVSFMPHKIPETSTYVFYTPKGIKFISYAKDRSGFSYGDIKPLDGSSLGKQIGIGKKGGRIIDLSKVSSKELRMFVSGKSYYKFYETGEGPLATIPSIGKKSFYGIIRSQEMPLKFGEVSSDLVVMKQVGSFKVSTPSSVKSLVVYDPHKIYSFGGRLLDETYFTKGIAVSKRVGGTIGAPGRYGFKTVEMPDLGYAVSKMRIEGIGSSIDRAISFFDIGKPKARISFNGGLGTKAIPKHDIVLPGGLGIKTAKISYPQLFKPMQPLFQRVSLGQLEAMESGISYVSSYWSGVIPTVASLSIPLTMDARATDLISKPLSVSMQLPINLQQQFNISRNIMKQMREQSSLNIQQLSNVSLSAQYQIQNQMTQQLQQQQQQQQQQLQMLTLSIIPTPTLQTAYGYGGTPPTTPPRIPHIPIPPILFPTGGVSRPAKKPVTGQAYDVYVKDRYIVSGKKKYKERYIRLGKRFSYEAAMGFGSTVVDKSAARSFKIKPVSGIPQRPRIPISSWPVLQNKFYPRKDGFIERTRFAIDSPGEIREISARGWVAERRKLHPKRKPVVSKRMKVFNQKDLRNMLKGVGM